MPDSQKSNPLVIKQRRDRFVWPFILLLVWASAEAQSPYDFKVQTTMKKLAVPVDFARAVYAEATKTVSLGFGQMFDKDVPDYRRYLMQFSASSHDVKTTYKIIFDWPARTASVTEDYTQFGEPEHSAEVFQVTNFNDLNVCLTHVSGDGVVNTITMSSELGSFIETVCSAPSSMIYHRATIWYGTCRN
jgi:hypothetical protein